MVLHLQVCIHFYSSMCETVLKMKSSIYDPNIIIFFFRKRSPYLLIWCVWNPDRPFGRRLCWGLKPPPEGQEKGQWYPDWLRRPLSEFWTSAWSPWVLQPCPDPPALKILQGSQAISRHDRSPKEDITVSASETLAEAAPSPVSRAPDVEPLRSPTSAYEQNGLCLLCRERRLQGTQLLLAAPHL